MDNTALTNIPRRKGKIATQVRNIHILILLSTFVLVVAMTAVVVNGIASDASENFARFYSVEAVGTFNLLINQDLVLVRKVSHSSVLRNWLADEEDPVKKAAAYNEMMDYMGTLQNAHLYIGIEKSLNEYSLADHSSFESFVPYARLEDSNDDDNWYFNSMAADSEYTLNIDVDKLTHIPSLWINHKVIKDNELVGMFCAGIPFEELAANLFAQYDNKNVKGYVIDKNGYIQLDSALPGFDPEHKNASSIFSISNDSAFTSKMSAYLNNIDGYFDQSALPTMIKLAKDSSRYASIVPISGTDWSVVTFFNRNSLYNFTGLILLLISMLVAFLVCTLVDSIFIYKKVLAPLNNLTKSLSASKFYTGEIYGCTREDEIGELAQTIQKMRDRLSTYNAELLRAARERERLIRIDQLTDIPNRRSFDERLPLEWGRSIRTGTPISILILDLDHFKNYNDTYGHLQGDKALQAVAKLFMHELKRSGDLVARWGGEEFAVLLVNTDIEGALDVAERIRSGVEALEIPLSNGTMSKMTVSIGANCLIPTADNILEDFIRHTDMALYTAKKEGRNRICQYENVGIVQQAC